MISQTELEAATGVHWEREVDCPAYRCECSPGQHPRHYAPRTPFYVLEPGARRPLAGVLYLTCRPNEKNMRPRSMLKCTRRIREGWDWIAVEAPPETPEWAGILDRLRSSRRHSSRNQVESLTVIAEELLQALFSQRMIETVAPAPCTAA